MCRDCRFDVDGRHFHYRAAAIIIEEGCVLLAKNDVAADYYYSVGGGVHLGETAEDAVKREVLEETGIEYEIERLQFVHENFFIDNAVAEGRKTHEISFFFLMKPRGKQEINVESFCTVGREYMHWVPIEKLKEIKAFPTFLADKITNLSDSVEHIVTNEID